MVSTARQLRLIRLYEGVLQGGDRRATAIRNCNKTGLITVANAAKLLCVKLEQCRCETMRALSVKRTSPRCVVDISSLFAFPHKIMVTTLMNGAILVRLMR
ncbi:hypothetical protein LSH36_236g03050 [Paralvinella palmiformis]|uniref:Uncharacterized protein n=1 Tax=Paralvinella palmiformis TaxID=53620 RepID=A0AAD9N3A9_9ANNE|nr:hypothetical protein LSH36_236g03050 [Paralvinella palmiformis]